MEIKALQTVHEGWARFMVATIRLDGHDIRREVEDHGHAAAVLAFDPVRRVALLVKQLRVPLVVAGEPTNILEAIAGLVDDEAPESAARREAVEEVGVALRAIEPVGAAWSMPGLSTERMHLFLGEFTPADRTGPGGGHADEHENIEMVEIPLRELAHMADDGTLTDMKTLVLVQTLRLRRPELFA